jgi:hypothetical protein
MNAEHSSVVSLEWLVYDAVVASGYEWNHIFEIGLMEFFELRDLVEDSMKGIIKS